MTSHYGQYRQPRKVEYKGPSKAAINKSKMPGWVDVVTPYLAEFVEDLKTVIQPSHRTWDKDNRVWHVNELFLEELVGLLQMHFDEVTTDLVEAAEPAASNMFKPVFAELKGDNLDKVYRALAQALHPDHGGNQEQMKLLNAAYQEAKK